MPEIKYIVLSDAHLGAANSLLTCINNDCSNTDTTQGSPTLTALVDCIRELIKRNNTSTKPTLVFNGDLVELALTSTNNAAMAFQRLIELIFPEEGDDLFAPDMIFLPGNHDHNLWEKARNYWYMNYLETIGPHTLIKDETHTTPLFSEPIPGQNRPDDLISVFLTHVALRSVPYRTDLKVWSRYPALAIKNEAGNKHVVFCHGHYVESMYSLMTSLRSMFFPDREMPDTFEELERENYAWVDFFWSTLGRSGSVGRDINLIYDKLQSPAEVNEMLRNLSTSLTKKKKNWLVRWAERKGLFLVLKATIGRMAANERNEPEVSLTPDAREGLTRLMEVYLLNQIKSETGAGSPANVSFTFGHTHKPFMEQMQFNGYPGMVKVFNSGGWVVDTVNQQPLHGGALILVDEDLDMVSLQMYREGSHRVSLQTLPDNEGEHCDLAENVQQQMDNHPLVWNNFSKVAEDEVALRRKLLLTMINSKA